MPLAQNQKAIVTGASSGIGRAIAEMLLEAGLQVWGTSQDGKRQPEHENFHACSLDLSDSNSIANFLVRIMQEAPDMDLLVNNAGYGTLASFEEFPVQEMDRQLSVLLLGPIRLTRAFLPNMLKQEHGTIVNVASLAADFPLPFFSLYNTAKAGLSNFSASLQLELHDTPIRVIDFQPGDFRTGFSQATSGSDTSESTPRLQRAWDIQRKHMENGPDPVQAATDLKKALRANKHGLVRTGTFFQARLAPFLARLGPQSWLQAAIRSYYRLGKR